MKTLSYNSKNWAEDELNIESGSNTQEALLKYIDSANFILNDCEIDALDILAGNKDAESSEYFQSFCSEKLLNEIDVFKKTFFDIPVDVRENRFNELLQKSESFVECRAVLSDLRKGVKIDKASLPYNHRLVDTILKVFLSSPAERAKIYDSISSLNKKEKKILHKEYSTFSPDVKNLCPEFSIYLKDETASASKKKLHTPVESNTIWLILIIAYIAFKILIYMGESQASKDVINRAQQELKTRKYNSDTNNDKKVAPQEIDEFLKYLEEMKQKKPNSLKEKLNEQPSQ